jgi:ribosomal protein S18 acetylase RimI-like enzyme
MVRLPGAGSSGVTPTSDLDIRRVVQTDQLADFEQTFLEAYPVPDLLPWRPTSFLGRALLDDPRWHLFVGYQGEQPIATAASHVTDHVVDVTMVSCRSESRGRGAGRALTQAAVDAASDRPALLLSSDEGQSLYRSMGFHAMTRFSLWIGQRPLDDS